MAEYYQEKACPCCNGSGKQFCQKDGMWHLCPACRGRGRIKS